MKKVNVFSLASVVIIIIVTALITSVATGVIMLNNSLENVNINNVNLSKDKDLQDFVGVYNTIVSKYYDKDFDKKNMLNAAEEAMLKYLGDKYTTYLNDSEYENLKNELSDTYKGIGIVIRENEIINVLKDSPAAKAGLMVRDKVLAINEVNTDGLKSDSIKSLIDTEKDIVDLDIERNEEKMSFSIKKEELPNIVYEIIENTHTGYLYIKNFSSKLEDQVKKALNELEKDGITSLVIDLRDNSGGYLSAAEDVASLFIEKGKIIYSLENANNKYTYKDETIEKRNYPVAILINENSASAAEVLTAALKESYSAITVGKKSYGKGKVQQIMSLKSGDSVKFTTAKWLTPSGNYIDGVGINPDYDVEFELVDIYDSQLLKAIEALNK